VNVDDPVAADANFVENTVTIADDGTNGDDPTPDNNTFTDIDILYAQPDISIAKDDGLTVIAANTTLTYTLTVDNLGHQDSTGVVVIDYLPVETTFISASDNPDGAAANYDSTTHTVTWPDFDLAALTGEILTVTIKVNDPLIGNSITNAVEAHDDGSNGPDSDPTNNTDIDINFKSGLSKTLIDTSEPTTSTNNDTGEENVTIGETVTYQVIFQIPAVTNMDDLLLTDVLGKGLAFRDCLSITPNPDTITTDVSGTASSDFSPICSTPTVNDIPESGDPDNPIGDGREVIFDFGNLVNSTETNGTITVQYQAVVLDVPENADGGSLDNQVKLTWTGGTETASGTPTLNIVEPDLGLTKEVDLKTAAYGQNVTYTLTVFTTQEATSDAFDVILTDVLPEGLAYEAYSMTVVSGVAPTTIDDSDPPGLYVIWDHFPLGETSVLTFKATVVETDYDTKIENIASVAWSSLPGDISRPQSPYNETSTERAYDPADPEDVYLVESSATFMTPGLPGTGFAPDVVTAIPAQPAEKAYTTVDGMWLEIPKLGLYLPISGIPLENGEWDVTWLWDDAGYLEGTAFPTAAGNSAITSHVYLPNGLPGPFVNLHTLIWGDQIIVHFNGQQYVYEVRELKRVTPDNLGILKHEEMPWLTLITCQGFQKNSGTYAYRIVVRAVLVSIQP
jgi:LPXTG-site transpeptidase (sortase) family protein